MKIISIIILIIYILMFWIAGYTDNSNKNTPLYLICMLSLLIPLLYILMS